MDAVNAGIAEANRRAAAKFDGLHGNLADEAAGLPDDAYGTVLDHIWNDLYDYLLIEKRFRKTKIRRLLAENLPSDSFQSVSRDSEDEGVRIALTVMNTIASATRLSAVDPGRSMRLLFGTHGKRAFVNRQQLAVARNHRQCPYTAEQYDAAVAKVGPKKASLAAELKVDRKTLGKYQRPA